MNLTWFNICGNLTKQWISKIRGLLHGDLLDIGCGQKKEEFFGQVDSYIGIEYPDTVFFNSIGHRHSHGADIFADAHALPFPEEKFDCVVLLHVLEHLKEPSMALSEIRRVLKEKGRLFIIVPFLYRIHSSPADYYRFTSNGLRYLLEKSGFEIEEMVEGGGMWLMLGQRIAAYIYSDILNLGYGPDESSQQRLITFFPGILLLPLIPVIVTMSRLLDKIHSIKKDTLQYLCIARNMKKY